MYADVKITLIDSITGDILHGYTDNAGDRNLFSHWKSIVRCTILDNTRIGRILKKFDDPSTYSCVSMVDFPFELHRAPKGTEIVLTHLDNLSAVKIYPTGFTVANMMMIPINNIEYLRRINVAKGMMKVEKRIYG